MKIKKKHAMKVRRSCTLITEIFKAFDNLNLGFKKVIFHSKDKTESICTSQNNHLDTVLRP